MQQIRTIVVCLVVLGVCVATAFALARTDRFCPDHSAVSPSGRYRFDSKHPNNALPRPAPFVCSGFTITLLDTTTNAKVWEVQQGKNDWATTRAWVTDSGRVVIYNGMLRLLDDRTGATVFSWDPFAELTDADLARIETTETTAGQMSTVHRLARWSFFQHAGKDYFAMRYFWGKRVVADLEAHVVLHDVPEGVNAAADDTDRKWSLGALEKHEASLARIATWEERLAPAVYDAAAGAELAAFVAGKLGVKEAIPFLRKLEECGYIGASGGIAVGRNWPGRPWAKRHDVRRAARTALRRLGESAGAQPVYEFDGGGWRLPDVGALAPRGELPTRVKAGMGIEELLALAGSPDYAQELYDEPELGGFAVLWEYDVDGKEPSTLRVVISCAGSVERVEPVRPAAWENGFRRDVGDWH